MSNTRAHLPIRAFELTSDQIFTLTHAMRIAGEKYGEHSRTCMEAYNAPREAALMKPEAFKRLAETFDAQKAECLALVERLEQAEGVTVGRVDQSNCTCSSAVAGA